MSDNPKAQSPVRVLIADDHPSVREALVFLLQTDKNIDIVAQANDGLQAVQETAATRPDVVLMDVSMPKLDGIEATRRITREYPHTRVLAMTMAGDTPTHNAMLKAGAAACVDKSAAPDELLQAIHTFAHAATL